MGDVDESVRIEIITFVIKKCQPPYYFKRLGQRFYRITSGEAERGPFHSSRSSCGEGI